MWPIRIECRAFLTNDGIPVVPCCNNSTNKTLCQPDTGIARVIVDIIDLTDPSASLFCLPGVDLNSARPLADDRPFNGQPKYCQINVVDKMQNLPTSSNKPREGKYVFVCFCCCCCCCCFWMGYLSLSLTRVPNFRVLANYVFVHVFSCIKVHDTWKTIHDTQGFVYSNVFIFSSKQSK